jgi:spore coat protein H
MPIKFKKNRNLRLTVCLICLIMLGSCYDELEIHSLESDPYLKFGNIYMAIDMSEEWFLLSLNENFFSAALPIETNLSSLTIDGQQYQEGDRIDFSGYEESDSLFLSFYTPQGKYVEGYMHFTALPVILLFHQAEIVAEPKVSCQMVISTSEEQEGSSLVTHAGIEIRGRSAAVRPKKSYSIELWTDASGSFNRDESILHMRNDDDWILDAMYIDKARMRNKVSMEIWRDICLIADNPKVSVKPYCESRYVELFINLRYQGIYCIGERMDQQQLNVEPYDGRVSGVIYKTEEWTNTTKFLWLADTNSTSSWDGWVQEYPDEVVCWRPAYDLVSFVINAPDAEFQQQVFNYFNMDNLVHYFLFVNLCEAYDNMGTNMYYARRESGDQFIVYPWDLDASWGRNWDSTLTNPSVWLNNIYYSRIFENDAGDSKDLLKAQWSRLREELLTEDDLIDRFKTYCEILTQSGAAGREHKRWPEMNLDLPGETEYIESWLTLRVEYLDEQINSLEKIDWNFQPADHMYRGGSQVDGQVSSD